jgi:hypothetical protein
MKASPAKIIISALFFSVTWFLLKTALPNNSGTDGESMVLCDLNAIDEKSVTNVLASTLEYSMDAVKFSFTPKFSSVSIYCPISIKNASLLKYKQIFFETSINQDVGVEVTMLNEHGRGFGWKTEDFTKEYVNNTMRYYAPIDRPPNNILFNNLKGNFEIIMITFTNIDSGQKLEGELSNLTLN